MFQLHQVHILLTRQLLLEAKDTNIHTIDEMRQLLCLTMRKSGTNTKTMAGIHRFSITGGQWGAHCGGH